MAENNKTLNTMKFIFGTLIGVVLVLIPFNFNGTIDTILFYYLKQFLNAYRPVISFIIMVLMVISAVVALYDLVAKPEWIRRNKILKNIFSTSLFYVVNRLIGAAICVLVYFQIGPEFLISADTGGSMFSLATQLSILVPMMLFLQTFILECGAMEFIGELIGFIVKPIFKVSEMGAVSIISAWVGPGNAAILATRDLFEEGYYTVKEAAIIGSQFSTSSVGWVVLVSSVFGVMDLFIPIFLVITLVGIIVAFVGVRIPPISNYPNTYVGGANESPIKVTANKDQSKFAYALDRAQKRAGKVTLENFTSKINNMLFYVIWLTPIIVCWGTLALILSIYTPILQWVSYPVELILNIANISEPAASATAIMSGFADNYLPVILGKDIASVGSRFLITCMSILQIVFMSEIASLLTSTKVVKNFKDVFLVFMIRTFVALPFVILAVKLLGLN